MDSQTQKYLQIIDSETSSKEDLKEARIFLLKNGLMRVNGKKYEVKTECFKFLSMISDKEWSFAGFVSPYDDIVL